MAPAAPTVSERIRRIERMMSITKGAATVAKMTIKKSEPK
jgi:hypothetical protein